METNERPISEKRARIKCHISAVLTILLIWTMIPILVYTVAYLVKIWG